MMRSWLTGGPKGVQEGLILPVFCRLNQGERGLYKYMRFVSASWPSRSKQNRVHQVPHDERNSDWTSFPANQGIHSNQRGPDNLNRHEQSYKVSNFEEPPALLLFPLSFPFFVYITKLLARCRSNTGLCPQHVGSRGRKMAEFQGAWATQ